MTLPEVTPPAENAGKLVLQTLHGAFYHNREVLYARKALACNVSHFAAVLAAETATGAGGLPKFVVPSAARAAERRKAKEAEGDMTAFEQRASTIAVNKDEVRDRYLSAVTHRGPQGRRARRLRPRPSHRAFHGWCPLTVTSRPLPTDRYAPAVPPRPFHPERAHREQVRNVLRAKEREKGKQLEVLSAGSSLMRVKAMMLFTPNPELLDPARAITPERVLDMCETLGIILEGSEPEYYLIWIAIEALSAPLPPLWRRVRREEASDEDADAQLLSVTAAATRTLATSETGETGETGETSSVLAARGSSRGRPARCGRGATSTLLRGAAYVKHGVRRT